MKFIQHVGLVSPVVWVIVSQLFLDSILSENMCIGSTDALYLGLTIKMTEPVRTPQYTNTA